MPNVVNQDQMPVVVNPILAREAAMPNVVNQDQMPVVVNPVQLDLAPDLAKRVEQPRFLHCLREPIALQRGSQAGPPLVPERVTVQDLVPLVGELFFA